MAREVGFVAAIGGFLRRHIIWCSALGLTALGIAGFLWWRARSERPRYVTATVTRGNIQRSVGATGALNPVVTVQVGSYVSGTIKKLGCDYNTEVVIGQVCATIDPVPFQLIVDQDRAGVGTAEAQLRKDQAALGYAKTAFERDSKLLAEGTVSQESVDNDKSAYQQAAAQIGLDQANIADKQAVLKAAEVNLAYTNIVSPVIGTVITRTIDVGQTVAASLQTPTLFIIGKNLAKMQVDNNVSEADVGQVRLGQEATFSVQAFPGRTFRGEVAQIRHGPITVQNVVTYDVVVAFDNPNRLLFPGMTADTHIVIDEHDNVLRVPLPAVRFNPEGLSRLRGASAGRAGGGPGSRTAGVREARPDGESEGRPAAVPVSGGAGGREASAGGGTQRSAPEQAEGAPEGGQERGRQGRAHRSTGAFGSPPEGRGRGGREGWGSGWGGAGERHEGRHQDRGRSRDERRSRVWVLSNGTLHAVEVTTGLDDGALIEVSSPDLHPGDLVVVNEASREEPRRAGPPVPNQNQLLRQGAPRL